MKGLKDLEFVVFDVETTGLSPNTGDRIVEIAALKVKNFKILDRFETLVNPQREISYGAFMVNGITQAMVEEAPTAREILPSVSKFFKNSYLIGHNINFDLGFLYNEFNLVGSPAPDYQAIIDTVQMSRKLLPSLARHSLSSVSYALGIVESQRHRAMADVEMTCQVFYQLLIKAKEQKIDNFQTIIDLFSLSHNRTKWAPRDA